MIFILIFLIIYALFFYIIYQISTGMLSFIFKPKKAEGISFSDKTWAEMNGIHKRPEIKSAVTREQTYEFRPKTFNEFIGQEEAKQRAETIVKKVNRNMKAHLFVNGIKGHGKTTFIEILANNLQAKMISYIGRQVDENVLANVVADINATVEKNVVFFIDEIDTMDAKVIKVLNPIIEKFELNGNPIKPFIFAGATINKHELVKNNPDTLDRIPHHLTFVKYNKEDIGKIIIQYASRLYPYEQIKENIIETISGNCKYNPRTAISLLEDFIVEQNIDKVLKNNHILAEGLTKTDVKIIKLLNSSTRAMGANVVAIKSGLSPDEYITEYEPFLVEYNYVNRVPSRVIGDNGKTFLAKYKEEV